MGRFYVTSPMILSWEDFTTHVKLPLFNYVSLFREDFTQELRPHVKSPHINDTIICNLGSFFFNLT